MTDYQRGLLRVEQILLQMAFSVGGAERCAYLDAAATLRTRLVAALAERKEKV